MYFIFCVVRHTKGKYICKKVHAYRKNKHWKCRMLSVSSSSLFLQIYDYKIPNIIKHMVLESHWFLCFHILISFNIFSHKLNPKQYQILFNLAIWQPKVYTCMYKQRVTCMHTPHFCAASHIHKDFNSGNNLHGLKEH